MMGSDEFASLAAARAYIDTIRNGIGSFSAPQVMEALERLHRVYRDYPELLLDAARADLLAALHAAAARLPTAAAIPLLAYCAASDPSDTASVPELLEKIAEAEGWPALPPILRRLRRSREIEWRALAPILAALERRGRRDALLRIISEVLDCVELPDENGAIELSELLTQLLGDGDRGAACAGGLAEVARSARRRLRNGATVHAGQGSQDREALLAKAEPLRLARTPAPTNPAGELGWASGRLSFDEFLLQWPCEIELEPEPDDAAFIDKAHRAILLRTAREAERDQYMRLLRDGVVTRTWVIEDLLASAELRSLERRLRVIYEGRVITAPGELGTGEDAGGYVARAIRG